MTARSCLLEARFSLDCAVVLLNCLNAVLRPDTGVVETLVLAGEDNADTLVLGGDTAVADTNDGDIALPLDLATPDRGSALVDFGDTTALVLGVLVTIRGSSATRCFLLGALLGRGGFRIPLLCLITSGLHQKCKI